MTVEEEIRKGRSGWEKIWKGGECVIFRFFSFFFPQGREHHPGVSKELENTQIGNTLYGVCGVSELALCATF